MILREDILDEVEAALEASDVLSGISVVQVDGTQEASVEGYLRDPGAVLLVGPVLEFNPRPIDQAAGAALGDARLMVGVAVNPNVNGARENPWDFEQLRAGVSSALLSVAADDHGERYRLISEKLSDFDPGTLGATFEFERAVQINPLS
jgi:hypothetical protein